MPAPSIRLPLLLCVSLLAGSSGATSFEETIAWLEAHRESRPEFAAGDVLSRDDLAKLRPFVAPGFVDRLDFEGFEARVQAFQSMRPHRHYREATLQFSGQTALAEDGSLANYVAGQPFSEERISSIAGKGKGKSRRRLLDADSDSTSTRYSMSHDSLVSLVPSEGGASGGSGEDANSVAPLAKPLRQNVSFGDLEDHAAGLGRDSGASRASSAISLTSTVSAGGGGSRASSLR